MKIKAPHHPAARFFFFASTQFLSYFLFVANARAYTLGLYFWTGLTDFIFATLNYLMIQLIAKDEESEFWSGAGYTTGGVCGSLLSIFVTHRLYGR